MYSLIKKIIPNKWKDAVKVLLPTSEWDKERKRLLFLERYTDGDSLIVGKPISFSDSLSFLSAYEEIFIQEIYSFKSASAEPFIIDAGSNIGLSILYFKSLYKNAEVIGIEPDPHIFNLLEKNVMAHGINGVALVNAALWKEDGFMYFESDKAMSGHLTERLPHNQSIKVRTVRLSTLIEKTVDLLKIDIEGAELGCIMEAQEKMGLVKNIFVEYHADRNKPQELDKLLSILTSNGFRYFIKEAFPVKQPFIKVNYMGDNDLQLNIFGIRL